MATREQLGIELAWGDITRLSVDAVVNAANKRLLGGGGVDYAIHRAAGPGLLAECRRITEVTPEVRCPRGEARITGGHKLRAKHVIHTVGPTWKGGDQGEPDTLAACYHACLNLAADHGLRTIAFPAISCGIYAYPVPEACEVAVRAVTAFQEAERASGRTMERVVFACINDDVYAAFRALVEPGKP